MHVPYMRMHACTWNFVVSVTMKKQQSNDIAINWTDGES